MTQEELLNLVHSLRSNEDCSDEQLCEVIKAANQTITIENLNNLFKQSERQKSSKSRAVKFTQKEINQMPKKFKKLFIYNKITAHVRIASHGVYEVRCMINGINYRGSSKDLDTAKAKFICDLKSDKQPKPKKVQNQPEPVEEKKLLFTDYFMKWLNTVKKPYIKDSSYQSYITVYNANIKNQFEGLTFDDINIFFLQEYMNGFTNSEKFRTAKKVYNLLSPCFDYAVADEIINRNPMAKIVIPKYEQKHGEAISRKEEGIIVRKLLETGDKYCQAYVFLTYTGLRVGELASAYINGDWITAVTEKGRKGLPDKTRRIPISPNLKRLLPYIDLPALRLLRKETVSRNMDNYLKGRHSHDLRHTFVTRCQECGIRREIVSMWVGHAADTSITSTVYTHLDQNEDLQIDEMKKFDYTV